LSTEAINLNVAPAGSAWVPGEQFIDCGFGHTDKSAPRLASETDKHTSSSKYFISQCSFWLRDAKKSCV
jgi:hypothetical protein